MQISIPSTDAKSLDGHPASDFELLANKDQPNGYAGLNAEGRLLIGIGHSASGGYPLHEYTRVSNNQITLSGGNYTAEFPVGAYCVFTRSGAGGISGVAASSYDIGLHVTNITLYGGDTITDASGWAVVVSTRGLAVGFANSIAGDSVAFGANSKASGRQSFASGLFAVASGNMAHAEGGNTTASADVSHAEGGMTTASANAAHAEGYYTEATGYYSHAEGYDTNATNTASHAEGYVTNATQPGSHAEGHYTTASGMGAHAEGYATNATNTASHAEGHYTTASGMGAHAEGDSTTASGGFAHAEGAWTQASGGWTHAEGHNSVASGDYSHAAGKSALAARFGEYARASGEFTERGDAQWSVCTLRKITAGNTQTELTLDGSAPTPASRYILATNKTYACDVTIVARKSDGTSAMFVRRCVIKNVSGTVSLEGSVQTIGTDINPGSWSVSLQADNTNKSLQIMVTGAASTSIRWVATVRAVEIGY